MTALLPTRVSIYDFLFEDTQPIDALLADQGNISLPQARILVENGIQAIISGLLAYHQNYGADAVLKKLLSRSQIKELRKHNAFNLDTMHTAMQHGQNVSDALFESVEVQKAVCKKLSQLTDLSAGQVRPLLGALSILCLREIAILADFAQLDASELETWFKQQPQFLHLDRKIANLTLNENICDANAFKMPTFDISWGQLTGCHLPKSNNGIMSAEQMPHYAKVIGRTTQTTSQTPQTTEDGQLIVDKADNSNILTFCAMDNIALPYQRWMLQLAKISDIYLSRNRLKVTPEPAQPPSRPFVSFGFLDNKTPETNNHSTAVVSDQNKPLWKNPVLILLVLVIGALSLLAVGKYQYKKSHADPADQVTQKQSVTKKPDAH